VSAATLGIKDGKLKATDLSREGHTIKLVKGRIKFLAHSVVIL